MTFRSVHHPEGASRATLTVQAQARPVALALIAVMTVGLAAALQGQSFLWPFVGGTAVAYAVAAAWGQSTLHRTVAEVEVRGPFASVRSMWEAAGRREHRLLPVASARLAYGELTVGLGDTIVAFTREDWPQFDGLVGAFREAAREGEILLAAA